MNYKSLDADKIVATVESIQNRINERFPGFGISRVKRRRALKAIHELRALAHIIDMHQLTKDPERVMSPGGETASSPKRKMKPFALGRYLDYCSEMLSIVGKIAALYVQNFDDNVVLASVNEVEALTTGLSRKIWQKIMILHSPIQRSPTDFKDGDAEGL